MNPLRYHPHVQRDIDEAMEYYLGVSESVSNAFWEELSTALESIRLNPGRFHFDPSGLRRFNLERYPYNILFMIYPDRTRIQVVRHNSRSPSYGTRRAKG